MRSRSALVGVALLVGALISSCSSTGGEAVARDVTVIVTQVDDPAGQHCAGEHCADHDGHAPAESYPQPNADSDLQPAVDIATRTAIDICRGVDDRRARAGIVDHHPPVVDVDR